MSNGGGESGSEPDGFHEKRKFSGNAFDRAVAYIALVQICDIAGFQGFQQSALLTLSDVAVRYIHNIGKTAHSYASLAGRMESNAFDIIQGLEDLGSGLGFAGTSDVDRCLASSGIVKDIVNYIDEAENILFAYHICRFPVLKESKSTPSFLQIGEESPDEHIPPYTQLKQTKETLSCVQRNFDELEGLYKEKGLSSLNLQQSFVCERLVGQLSTPTVDGNEAMKATEAAKSNPFLAKPLRFGAKEVSLISHPSTLLSEAAEKSSDFENHVVSNHVLTGQKQWKAGYVILRRDRRKNS